MDVETQRVNWWIVIGGVFLAVVTGIFVGLFATLVSANTFHEQPIAAITVAATAVFFFYFALFVLARRWRRDLAMGLMIGGCLAALCTGACGYLLINLTVH